MNPARRAAAARRELARMSRPSEAFDASRYFRSAGDLGFYNVGMTAIRRAARVIASEHRQTWTVDDAVTFADALIKDRYLETKALAIETLARYPDRLAPRFLPRWKRWLADNHAANWATTDTLCGLLIGPLLLKTPSLVPKVAGWASHGNMWVRRASAVGLIASARNGRALDAAYKVATRLHGDREDLIQKAVGWLLREAGKTDPGRLERYLRAKGPTIPRTTLRYAIERFPLRLRQDLLAATRASAGSRRT